MTRLPRDPLIVAACAICRRSDRDATPHTTGAARLRRHHLLSRQSDRESCAARVTGFVSIINVHSDDQRYRLKSTGMLVIRSGIVYFL